MRAVKALLLFVFLIPCLPGKVSAQSIDDGGLWFAALGNGDIEGACFANRRVKWWFDAHYRLLDDAGGFNQSIVRPGIGLDMGNKSALIGPEDDSLMGGLLGGRYLVCPWSCVS